MNRKTLQRIAKERLKDVKALLGRKRWSGAYYLCGYVIECALKACLLRYLAESDAVFGKPEYLQKQLVTCWTHDLEKLIKLAGLEPDFGVACGTNPKLNASWVTTKVWKETSRYADRTEAEASALFAAVSDGTDGVFQWIQSRW